MKQSTNGKPVRPLAHSRSGSRAASPVSHTAQNGKLVVIISHVVNSRPTSHARPRSAPAMPSILKISSRHARHAKRR